MTIKYIKNKDLLEEIQRSKATYCHFVSSDYSTYDLIVTSVDELTPALLTSTITTKASKMSTKTDPVDPKSIDPETIVFRVMTDSHLPPETDEKRRKKSSTGEWVAKPNFPPFKHYIMKKGKPVEVGRSHWKEGLHNGQFCIVHGKITNRLAQMFMLLVEQYSHRGNWRGYCVDEATEALTQRGWLNMHQITENDLILSYDDGQLKWSKIKSIFKDDYDGNMFHLSVIGMDALVTPRHKFVTSKGLKEVEYLLETDRIVLTGDPVEPEHTSRYADQFVELVGWFVTEGNCYLEEGRNYTRVTLYQNEGENANRIRKCLTDMNVRFSESLDENEYGNTEVTFHLTKETCEALMAVAENRVLSMPFILSLSQEQRELLIDTIIEDGWLRRQYDNENSGRSYCQKDKAHVDAFIALCTMAGLRTSCKLRDIVSFGKPTRVHIINIFSRGNHSRVENIDFHGGKRNGRDCIGKGKVSYPNEPTVPYKGKVWCPETEYGSFMARRNGYVYLTGNTYVDEMRNHALMHLSQVGLQFDESRSDNPFAFYTQIIKHCFTRILNLERRNQNIRDDLLIMAGVNPSYTRQVDNEMDQREEETKAVALKLEKTSSEEKPKKEPKKRGRKPKIKA